MSKKSWATQFALSCVITIGIIALLVILTGCGKKDDLQGSVTGKTVKPGYTYTYMMPQYTTVCSGTGTTRSCRQQETGVIPIIYNVPTCFQITVRGTTSGDTCISEGEWNAIALGDDYVGKDVDPKDRQEEQ